MPNSHEFIVDVNRLLAKLDESGDLNTGIEVANQVVRLLGTHDTKEADLVVDEQVLQLPNAERYDRWFHNHPWMGGERAAFELTDAKDAPIQAKFYWLQKRSRQFIAGSVHFTENWEDADYTHNDNFKVGIDFFLAPNGRSVIVALSNRGNIRVVELQHKLNNTQVDIFTKWRDAIQISSTEALHTTLWESFKLQSVNKDFYTGVANSFTELLQHLKSIGRDEEDAKLFASRLLGRLLFVWFLRKKGIIDESLGYFDASSDSATNYYKRSLERLFFNTLNTPIDDRDEFKKELQKSLFPDSDDEPQAKLFQVDNKTPYLNGGLFEPHDNDWYKDAELTLPKGFFANLYNHFDQFNFTTDESSPEYEQVAIDPEMLGRVFESLLATQIDDTGQQARKAKGAFYTPREIVSYMCRESLRSYLHGKKLGDERYRKAIDELLDRSDHEWAGAGTNSRRDAVPKEYRTVIVEALDTVMILDPACGSGAFPMGMLQLLIKTYERLEGRFDPYKTKLQIVQNNIFGVDIEPMAVEISRLRAWLSLIVDEDDSRDVAPLPNLDFKFVCANTLIPLDDSKADLFNDPELHKQLAEIRQTYFNARKPHTKKAAQQKYYKLTGSNTGLFDNTRTKQLKSFDPFINSHPADFFDIDQMFGVENGFDIVIGNPPYGAKYPSSYKDTFKKAYSSANTIKNIQKGSLDTFSLFIDCGYQIIRKDGVLNYIVPLTITSGDSMTGLHKLLMSNCEEINISSYCDRPVQIFKNAHKKLSIISFKKTGSPIKKLNMTKMYRLQNEAQLPGLMEKLSFVNVLESQLMPGRLPKVSYPIEIQILNKIFNNQSNNIKSIVQDSNGSPVYYRSAGGMYFNVITNYANGLSSEKKIDVKPEMVNPMAAILSSTLFWWYQQVYTDCLNLKASEIESFPIPSLSGNQEALAKLDSLYKEYAVDIEKNVAIRKSDSYKNITSFKEYKLRKSFAIVDKIDNIVCSLYDLSAEETNYIKGYEREFRTTDEIATEE